MNEGERKIFDALHSNDYVKSFADQTREILQVETYAYAADRVNAASPINAATVRTENIQIDGNSDFICFYLSGAALVTGASVPVFNPSIGVQVTDNMSKRTFFDTFTPMPHVCGTGGFTFYLASPRILRARTQLTVSFQALSTSTFDQAQFVMHGSRIYYGGAVQGKAA